MARFISAFLVLLRGKFMFQVYFCSQNSALGIQTSGLKSYYKTSILHIECMFDHANPWRFTQVSRYCEHMVSPSSKVCVPAPCVPPNYSKAHNSLKYFLFIIIFIPFKSSYFSVFYGNFYIAMW